MKYWRLSNIAIFTALIISSAAQANDYITKCSICHGTDGVGKLPSVPNLANSKLGKNDIVQIITQGKGRMPAVSVDQSEAEKIAQHVINNIQNSK